MAAYEGLGSGRESKRGPHPTSASSEGGGGSGGGGGAGPDFREPSLLAFVDPRVRVVGARTEWAPASPPVLDDVGSEHLEDPTGE
jgi:hypothetical protein